MNEFDRKYSTPLGEWVDDRLEAYVDGELPEEERLRVEAFVREDEDAARRVDLARRVQATLAAREPSACPPDVTEAVLAAARAGQRADRPALAAATRRRLPAAWADVLRPSLAAAALVALVVISALIGGAPRREAPAEATSAEVEQALREARWALAYVSDVGRRAGRSIRHEILEERLAEPVQRALDDALRTGPSS